MKPLKIIDLFCGTGAFSKGFENHPDASFETVLGVDLLPTSVDTFRLNHPRALGVAKDIRALRRDDVAAAVGLRRGDVDLIVGGPPCQGFSSIRPFRSDQEEDARNSLFEQYAGFVHWFRPRMFVLENVVGLATYQGGATLAAMLECFRGLGYDCDWRILNAAHFGVPQKRERLILIGAERGGRIVFPSPTHACEASTIGFRDRQRMLTPEAPSLFSRAPSLPPALTAMDAISDLPPIASGQEADGYDRPCTNDFQRARRRHARALTLHASTRHSPRMLEIIRHAGRNISSIPPHLISSGFSSCYSRLAVDEPAVTITVNFVHPASNRCIHPTLDRALTAREGARLQSFDDDFAFAGTRTQVVKQIGNAVPPLLGTAIAGAVAPMLA